MAAGGHTARTTVTFLGWLAFNTGPSIHIKVALSFVRFFLVSYISVYAPLFLAGESENRVYVRHSLQRN